MDTFFTQPNCDRCGKSLKNGRMMSMFNTDCLCLDCIETERQHYRQAVEADHAEIRKGNFNFKGIG
jgi:hypothetical protein